MIITKIKPLDEILQYIESCDKILMLGCSKCSYGCSTGVEEKVKEFAKKIRRERKRLGKPIKVLEKILTKQCDPSALKPLEEFKDKVPALISLGCGVGVNLIADLYPKIEIYPGVNTLFLGAKIKEGYWVEKCRACGDCIIGYTAGLCPITRCPKNLLNGPCGGVKNGICEVRKTLPCVWYKIVMRLKNRGKLRELTEIWEAKDWRPAGGEGVRELKEE